MFGLLSSVPQGPGLLEKKNPKKTRGRKTCARELATWKNWRMEKIGDSGVNPVSLKYCWCTICYSTSNSGRDIVAGITIIWGTSPCRILQIHSLYQVATGTPCHVPLRRRGIFITIVDGFGTNFMIPSDWDWASKCVCGPNFMSNLIGESPIFWLLERSRAAGPKSIHGEASVKSVQSQIFFSSFFSAKSFWVVRPRKDHFSQEVYTWW